MSPAGATRDKVGDCARRDDCHPWPLRRPNSTRRCSSHPTRPLPTISSTPITPPRRSSISRRPVSTTTESTTPRSTCSRSAWPPWRERGRGLGNGFWGWLRSNTPSATSRRRGSSIVAAPQLYGATYTLFAHLLPEEGVGVRFAVDDRHESLESLIDDAHRRGVLRVDRQSRRQRGRPSGGVRHGSPTRCARHRRQHRGHPHAPEAFRARGRRRRPLPHEVRRWARHDSRWTDRRRGQLPLGRATPERFPMFLAAPSPPSTTWSTPRTSPTTPTSSAVGPSVCETVERHCLRSTPSSSYRAWRPWRCASNASVPTPRPWPVGWRQTPAWRGSVGRVSPTIPITFWPSASAQTWYSVDPHLRRGGGVRGRHQILQTAYAAVPSVGEHGRRQVPRQPSLLRPLATGS